MKGIHYNIAKNVLWLSKRRVIIIKEKILSTKNTIVSNTLIKKNLQNKFIPNINSIETIKSDAIMGQFYHFYRNYPKINFSGGP